MLEQENCMRSAVTTSNNPKPQQSEKAKQVSKDLNIPMIEKLNKSYARMLDDYELDFLYVVEKERMLIRSRQGDVFWHPGTAVLKVWNQSKGDYGQLLKAVELKEGDRVLDCTLGYGSDAIVMASAVGNAGSVVGLEANENVAYLTADGLKNYEQVSPEVKASMERVEVIHDRYENFLSQQPDNFFDVVYFDPMFRSPNQDSKSMSALRQFADMSPLSQDSIREALRVCRRRVVVKERIGSGVFKALGITERVGEIKFGSVVYGIIRK